MHRNDKLFLLTGTRMSQQSINETMNTSNTYFTQSDPLKKTTPIHRHWLFRVIKTKLLPEKHKK